MTRMKLPRLKIPTKELPLVALGVTCVLVSGLVKISVAKYLVIAMFFGILSKETRWTFWGFNVLIEMFRGFRALLRTDRYTMVLDMAARMGSSIQSVPVPNVTSPSAVENFLVNVGNNPILTNPVVVRVILIIFTVFGAALWVVSVLGFVVYIVMILPIICHLGLMLYIFHRDELKILLETFSVRDPIPEWVGRLVAPYLIQGMAIQVTLGTAIFPLVFYRILKHIGFYDRIPGIQT